MNTYYSHTNTIICYINYFRLNEQYSYFIEVILTPPKNTDELIKLIAFVADTRDNILPKLSKQTIEVLSCDIFLMDYIEFTKEEMKEKTSTFRWAKYINNIISMNSKMVLNKTKEFKEVLQARIKKFNDDLNIYKLEIDDFRLLGDINDIQIYAEKSQNLDDKLTEALETIDDFNKQEKYFQMNESVYPLRKSVNIPTLRRNNCYTNDVLP